MFNNRPHSCPLYLCPDTYFICPSGVRRRELEHGRGNIREPEETPLVEARGTTVSDEFCFYITCETDLCHSVHEYIV